MCRGEDYGSMEGIIKKLNSDKEKGITPEYNEQRRVAFGSNERDAKVADTCCSMFKSALDDFMLKLLTVCAIVSITVDMSMADPHELSHAWIDGFAIMVAVLVVSGVGSIVDWKKEVAFVNKRNDTEKEKCIDIIREGKRETVHPGVILVGDLICLKVGDQIPVDGLLIEGPVGCDESAMTGESDECHKDIPAVCEDKLDKSGGNEAKHQTRKVAGVNKHALPSSVVQSGCSVSSGSGKMIAIVVGDYSSLGLIESKLEQEDDKTPLYHKLDKIALDIGKLGTIFALLTFHALMIRFIWEGLINRQIDLFGGEKTEADGCSANGCFVMYIGEWFKSLTIGIVIIVVAVPEGLPLAVMITLAYSIIKMLEDQCDVKKLSSCEIMGGADNICSDKTGTLTNNVMEVVKLYSGKDFDIGSTVKVMKAENGIDLIVDPKTKKAVKIPNEQDFVKMGLNADLIDKLTQGICTNVPLLGPSPTDEAMMYLVRGCNIGS